MSYSQINTRPSCIAQGNTWELRHNSYLYWHSFESRDHIIKSRDLRYAVATIIKRKTTQNGY